MRDDRATVEWTPTEHRQPDGSGDRGTSPSPFSFPSHVRCREHGRDLEIEFRYVDGEEPMTDSSPTASGVVAAVGRFTGRLRALHVPKELIRALIQQGKIAGGPKEKAIGDRLSSEIREALRGLQRQPTEMNQEVAVGEIAPRIEHCIP